MGRVLILLAISFFGFVIIFAIFFALSGPQSYIDLPRPEPEEIRNYFVQDVQPAPVPLSTSDSFEIEAYVDSSMSMQGYLVEGSHYDYTINQIASRLPNNDGNRRIDYFKFGSVQNSATKNFVSPIVIAPGDSIHKILVKTSRFYNQLHTPLSQLIRYLSDRARNPERKDPFLYLVLTDGVQSEAGGYETAPVTESLRDWIGGGFVSELAGLQTQFSGTIYSELLPKNGNKHRIPYADKNRPFYILAFADSNRTLTVFNEWMAQWEILKGTSPQDYVVYSPSIHMQRPDIEPAFEFNEINRDFCLNRAPFTLRNGQDKRLIHYMECAGGTPTANDGFWSATWFTAAPGAGPGEAIGTVKAYSYTPPTIDSASGEIRPPFTPNDSMKTQLRIDAKESPKTAEDKTPAVENGASAYTIHLAFNSPPKQGWYVFDIDTTINRNADHLPEWTELWSTPDDRAEQFGGRTLNLDYLIHALSLQDPAQTQLAHIYFAVLYKGGSNP